MIENEMVQVNGEVETRKRKKINVGDIIAVGDERFVTALDESA